MKGGAPAELEISLYTRLHEQAKTGVVLACAICVYHQFLVKIYSESCFGS